MNRQTANQNLLWKESETMLSKEGVIIRYMICLGCFLLSGTETITGWPATICGVVGTIELATALLQYSPWTELMSSLNFKTPQIPVAVKTR